MTDASKYAWGAHLAPAARQHIIHVENAQAQGPSVQAQSPDNTVI
jgi:hypothetical protein